jgi:hypothetical protein
LVAEFEERRAEFLGHIDTPAAAVLRRGKHVVHRIIGSLHHHKPVRATVLAIDEELNQIKVQTEAGQRLMLFLPPESLAHLRVGAPCLLQVTNRSTREASRPPEHEGAFW